MHVLSALFEVMDRHGSSTALEERDDARVLRTLSYRELRLEIEASANTLAPQVRPGDVVAVELPRSVDAVVALLAVWRVGATYLPIAPDWPEARKRLVLDDSRARVHITTPIEHGEESYARRLDAELPSHLIYTSGSTGAPKGVLVPHRGLEAVLRAQIAELGLGPGKRSLLILSLAFDASLSDIGTALLSGATLVLDRRDLARDPPSLARAIAAGGITYVDLPPALLSQMDPMRPLEHVLVGGEPAAEAALDRWARELPVTIAYGPTEATICTSLMTLSGPVAHGELAPTIGRPLPGVRYRIDDGELLISTEGLALGYLRRPALDEARFFVDDAGTRWFKSGDRVTFDAEANEYRFLGRVDRQCKVRGLLVAPEEIEAILLSGGAARAAVIPRGDRLVAFVESDADLDGVREELRARLRARLPAAMVPASIVALPVGALPTTSSGKVDLERLRETPLGSLSPQEAPKPPETPTEARLQRAFAAVLGLDDAVVGRDADFFALGGDSFKVLELAARGERWLGHVAPAWIYEHSVLEDLARALDERHARDELGVAARELRADVARRIANRRAPTSFMSHSTARRILLTGATGFLGGRVLAHLLRRDDVDRVYCLVRGGDPSRLRAKSQRAVVVDGDVTQPRLGLERASYEELAGGVSDVMHLAAAVDMVRPYRELAAPNVDGAIEIAIFADTLRAKHLHYASTLSVFVGSDRSASLLREDEDLAGMLASNARLYGGYAQSKWAAELALRSMRQGSYARTTVHRFGLITSDAAPCTPPRGCQLALFLDGLVDLGLPDLHEEAERLAVDITPVDYAAHAMVELALGEGRAGTFHIANERAVTLAEIVAALRRHSAPQVSRPVDELVDLATSRDDVASAVVAASLRKCVSGGRLGRSTDLFLATGYDFDTRATAAVLAARGLVCPSPAPILEAHVEKSARRHHSP